MKKIKQFFVKLFTENVTIKLLAFVLAVFAVVFSNL